MNFDPVTHTYSQDGVRYASVTEIIREAGLYGDSVKFADDYSRERGRVVHKIIELWSADKLDESTIDPAVAGYFKAWLTFIEESGFFPGYLEHVLHDPLIKVAGRADMIGPYEKKAAILDIKTGQPNPATAIQLAGYEYLYGAACRRIVVQLKEDGSYRLKEYRDRHDRDVFLGAVAVHNWRIANLKGG